MFGLVVTDIWLEFHVSRTFRNIFTYKLGGVFNAYFTYCINVNYFKISFLEVAPLWSVLLQ